MKKRTILIIILSIVLSNCTNNTSKLNSADSSIYELNSRTLKPRQNIERVKIVYLFDILKPNKSLFTQFSKYIDEFNLSIRNEDDIIAVFNKRDSLIDSLNKQLEKYYYKTGQENIEQWEKIDNELNLIGFSPIYAEGSYIDLNVSPILKDEIKKVGSKEFILFNDFNNLYTRTLGGEYPFLNTDAFFKAYLVAEKLYTEFPESKYFKKIKPKFYELINYITDVHEVTFIDEKDINCQCFNFTYSYYPYSTNCETMIDFVRLNKKSVISPVLEKIIKNKSLISIDPNKTIKATIYVISIEEQKSIELAKERSVEYILSGKDYVHPLTLKQNDKEKYFVTYRFYTDKQTADEYYEKIKKTEPNAKIIKVMLKEEYEPAEIIK